MSIIIFDSKSNIKNVKFSNSAFLIVFVTFGGIAWDLLTIIHWL